MVLSSTTQVSDLTTQVSAVSLQEDAGAAASGASTTTVGQTPSTSVGSMAGREVVKSKETSTDVFAQAVAHLPPQFKAKFGTIGVVLADALPSFSLSLVALVAGYSLDPNQAKDFGIKEALQKSDFWPVDLSGECFAMIKELGPNETSLDLHTPFSDGSVCITSEWLQKHIIPHFPNLTRLKIYCDVGVPYHFDKFTKLEYLELTKPYFVGQCDEGTFAVYARKMPQLKSLVLYNISPQVIKDLPALPNLTELELRNSGHIDLNVLLDALRNHRQLKTLRLCATFFKVNRMDYQNPRLAQVSFDAIDFMKWTSADDAGVLDYKAPIKG